MKRKGNTAWRSRNGQMIKARQIRLLHGTVMLDYYLRKTMQKMQTRAIYCLIKYSVKRNRNYPTSFC